MTIEAAAGGIGLTPVMAFALVGVLGVGSQWVAWKLRMPAIVLMLLAGLVVGPGLGLFDPMRDIGALIEPMIAIAVAIILFEGGMTLNLQSLREAAVGVRRLVLVGAPVGWLGSALALHYVAGLGWASATVFGGIMIVTGPTVIAPLLRQARLARRPAQLLQWEAIVNDPIGAMAAVMAFETVSILNTAETWSEALWDMTRGLTIATALGFAAGWALAESFRRAQVPEYMKVSVLVSVLLAVFAIADYVLHESGLLTVTIMGIYIANAGLPSYTEIRRFKEHATVLLVSGVFILLAASMKIDTLAMLDWRAGLFIAVIVLLVRPATVLIALAFSNVPWPDRLLVAMTGPRGVVLVAVAGFFAERLVSAGIDDAGILTPLAFALVAATVVLHGFSLAPLARLLGLASTRIPGVIFAGGSQFAASFAKALEALDVPVLITDANRARLRGAREAGLPVYVGDILADATEHSVEFISYGQIVALSDNDAYNTLVATDLGPDFGRDNVFQLKRAKQEQTRHALPPTLGGRAIAQGKSYLELARHMGDGWQVRTTELSEEFTLEDWRTRNPDSVPLAEITTAGQLRILGGDAELKGGAASQVIALSPPKAKTNGEGDKDSKDSKDETARASDSIDARAGNDKPAPNP